MPIWRVEVKPNAEKRFRRLDKDTRRRIVAALTALEQSERPLVAPNVRALTGELHGDFRLRVGEWRILFTPDAGRKVLNVYAILPRGRAYR